MKGKLVFGILAVLLVLSCLSISGVSAHRLHIVHKISEIEIEAYFGGNVACRDADVKVYDKDGNLYVEGVTDDEGKFSFPPKIGVDSYTVVVDAVHMPGHKAEAVINLSQETAGTSAGGMGTEMPLYTRTIAGFGYLIGLAGAAMLYMSWKLKKK
ncbi:MAG: carboxypeptidase-like regulatory domain-containing protein [Methanophagales archaeon]|nr:carboxypeptidase-like regulatory domain-containing protein [Methanophagales archaeon]MCW3141193.1 carboxypeptidase-like regulatory domain-containing protein [Methanophagales archaeon]